MTRQLSSSDALPEAEQVPPSEPALSAFSAVIAKRPNPSSAVHSENRVVGFP
jgi:hypothetical protein